MLVHVAAGHAASPSSVWLLNILVQWVHMTAVGVWVGGLFWLLLGFRGRDHRERAAAVGVFTRVATWTLVVVLATGLLRAVAEVGSVSASPGHPLRHRAHRQGGARRLPGRPRRPEPLLLGARVACRRAGSPAREWSGARDRSAARDGGAASAAFGLNSRGELAVALAVLAATAILSGLAPAGTAAGVRSAAERQQGSVTASGSDYATTVRVELTLTPGRAGKNAYVLWVDDYDTGDPLPTVTSVRLECSLPARPELNAETVELKAAPDGSWRGAGLDFSVAGRWAVVAYVQMRAAGTTVDLEVQVRPAP